MHILDKILEQYLLADVTETPWWTDAVFRALEQDTAYDQGAADAVAVMTNESQGELT